MRFSKLTAISAIFFLMQMGKTCVGMVPFLVITLMMHFNFFDRNSIPAAIHEVHSDYGPLDQIDFAKVGMSNPLTHDQFASEDNGN